MNGPLWEDIIKIYSIPNLIIWKFYPMFRGGKILQDRETKILSSKMNAEIETAHDDIAKLWKSISDLERLKFMTSDHYIV